MITGSLEGGSRADLIEKAKAVAATYYGTGCVSVRLLSEEADIDNAIRSADGRSELSIITFSADFEAQEHHVLARVSYGPDKCHGCGLESWPHAPLPQAVWS